MNPSCIGFQGGVFDAQLPCAVFRFVYLNLQSVVTNMNVCMFSGRILHTKL